MSNFSASRGNRVAQNTAGTSSVVVVVGTNVEVTIDTPISTPRVSDHESVLTSIGSITNSQDGVVQISSASRSIVENTRLVGLEDIGSFNSNNGGNLVNGSLQSRDTV